MTDNVKLFSCKKYPFVLLKMQRDPRDSHVAEEMVWEAKVYGELSKNADVANAVPVFYGFSTHLGVPLPCVSAEGPSFADIGFEHLSRELKMSAMQSLQLLSQAGLVHNDLALRNIVQSKENTKEAKIIDFGRAEFTENRELLQEQVETLKAILKFGE